MCLSYEKCNNIKKSKKIKSKNHLNQKHNKDVYEVYNLILKISHT